MKNIITFIAIIFSATFSFAQTDAVSSKIGSFITLSVKTRPISVDTITQESSISSLNTPSSPNTPETGSESGRIDFNRNLVEMPSPNMVGLINQVNANADLFTGKANANLPIYTLKSYDIEVPISLDYAANGLKVDEMGSWVGSNWNLNVGGAITRIMKNSPDESIRKVSFSNPTVFGQTPRSAREDIYVYGYLNLKGNKTKVFPNGIDINNFENLSEIEKKKVADYSNWFPPKKTNDEYGDGQDGIGVDTEPDEFYFKFGSYAGKFVFNPDGQILCIPDFKFKISQTFQTIDGERQIVTFKVVTQEGYTYSFGDEALQAVEKTKRRYFQTTQYAFYKYKDKPSEFYRYDTQTLTPFETAVQGSEINAYTSAWHLTKIESPTGDAMNFSYDNNNVQYVDDRSYSASTPNFRDRALSWQPSDMPLSKVSPFDKPIGQGYIQKVYATPSTVSHFISIVYVSAKKLNKIATSNGKEVSFKADVDRVDLYGGKKLEEISLSLAKAYVRINPIIISKKWKFKYADKVPTEYPALYTTYKSTEIIPFIESSYLAINPITSAGVGSSFKSDQLKVYNTEFNRTLLRGIDEEGYKADETFNTISLYSLNYFNENDALMPKRFSNMQDRYGYYSGNINFSGRSNIELSNYTDPDSKNVSSDFVLKMLPIISSNRRSDINFAKYYALQKITNSLGGTVEYNYAFNGDLKVSQISTTTNGIVQTKNFQYEAVFPTADFTNKYQINTLSENNETALEGVVVYSSKPYNLSYNHGSLFTCGKVTVTEAGNGSAVSYIHNWTPAAPSVKKMVNSTISVIAGPAYPFPMFSDYEWLVGSVVRTDINRQDGKLLKQTLSPLDKFRYLWSGNTSTSYSGAPTTQGLKGVKITIKNKNAVNIRDEYQYGVFSYTSAALVPTETQEIDYFEKSNDPNIATSISKTQTSEYSTINNRIKKQTTKNSDGKDYTTTYKYAFDYAQTAVGSTGCDPLLHSYKKLVDKNMIGIPLETVVNKGLGGGSKVIYDCEARPKYFYKYGENGQECISPGAVKTADEIWFLQYQITEYNTYSRPKTVKYACNDVPISLVWDKDRIYTKTYSNRTWMYEYNFRNNLLERFTDFDGLVSSFEYDEFFRLKTSKGRNENVINTYTYTLGAENSVSTVSQYLGIDGKVFQNKQVMDGFGRTLTATKKGFTPNRQDLTTRISYDNYGRPENETDPTKGTLPKKTVYEPSPLNRVKSVYPHGSGKSITYKYGVNEEPISVDGFTYSIGSLYVSTVFDEDGKPTVSYTDKLGRAIMGRKQLTSTQFADTKYIYNDRGQVLKTLPPDGGDPFIYEYNTDGSLIRKTIPGFKKKEDGTLKWMTYGYDKRGRLSTTTDPNDNTILNEYTDHDELYKTYLNWVNIKEIEYGTTGINNGKPNWVNVAALDRNGGVGSGRYLKTSFVYDNLGRVTGSTSDGLANTDQMTMYYWNSLDMVQYEDHQQTFTGSPTPQYYRTFKSNYFDHSGRPVTNFIESYDKNWNQLGQYTQATNSYLENGWLKNKTITENWYNNLQKIDYSYNSRGWLTAINEPRFSNIGLSNEGPTACWTASGEPNCTKKATNFYATIDFSKSLNCDWGFCFENGVKDMKITYSLNHQDGNGQTQIRSNTVAVAGGDPQKTYYPYSSWAGVTAEIRLDNLEASLDAITTEIWNVLLWRAWATYDYDEASQLSSIFRAKLKEDLLKQFCPEDDKLFTEKIHYEDKHPSLNSTPPQYNGNISWVEWQVGDRRKQAYGYTYDGLDRLTGAHFAELLKDGSPNESSRAGTPRYDEWINYKDMRGNIQNLGRYGLTKTISGGICYEFNKIDELTYTYDMNSNRLATVTDALTDDVAKSKGVVNGGGAFTYDFNGNMTEDKSKKLTIKYNFLNLPYEFTFEGKGRIYITYDADGNKLRKELFNAQGVKTSKHDYINGSEYENNVLESMNFGFTRLVKDNVSSNTYRMEYVLADHLGNNRVVFTDLNGDGRIDANSEIVQENHYYPMGMQMEGSWNNKKVLGSPKQNYKFNGSEWSDDFGLAWGDHGARYYLPAVGVWNGIDALAEKYTRFSPFHFTMGNPIRFSDPTGYGSESFSYQNSPNWKPQIIWGYDYNSLRSTGQLGVMREDGDNAQTLASFLNVSQADADKIYGTMEKDGSIKLPNSVPGVAQINDAIEHNLRYPSEALKYNCYNSALRISQGLNLFSWSDGQSVDMRDFTTEIEFVTGLYNKYNEVSTPVFGKTVIGIGQKGWTEDYYKHAAIYLGASSDGTQYVWTKNGGWNPFIEPLKDNLKRYGEIIGMYQLTPPTITPPSPVLPQSPALQRSPVFKN
jgi:RHS repeat-associated protein